MSYTTRLVGHNRRRVQWRARKKRNCSGGKTRRRKSTAMACDCLEKRTLRPFKREDRNEEEEVEIRNAFVSFFFPPSSFFFDGLSIYLPKSSRKFMFLTRTTYVISGENRLAQAYIRIVEEKSIQGKSKERKRMDFNTRKKPRRGTGTNLSPRKRCTKIYKRKDCI